VEADAAVPPARINKLCSNANEPDRRAAERERIRLNAVRRIAVRKAARGVSGQRLTR
jgi:hypothetical protein